MKIKFKINPEIYRVPTLETLKDGDCLIVSLRGSFKKIYEGINFKFKQKGVYDEPCLSWSNYYEAPISKIEFISTSKKNELLKEGYTILK